MQFLIDPRFVWPREDMLSLARRWDEGLQCSRGQDRRENKRGGSFAPGDDSSSVDSSKGLQRESRRESGQVRPGRQPGLWTRLPPAAPCVWRMEEPRALGRGCSQALSAPVGDEIAVATCRATRRLEFSAILTGPWTDRGSTCATEMIAGQSKPCTPIGSS